MQRDGTCNAGKQKNVTMNTQITQIIILFLGGGILTGIAHLITTNPRFAGIFPNTVLANAHLQPTTSVEAETEMYRPLRLVLVVGLIILACIAGWILSVFMLTDIVRHQIDKRKAAAHPASKPASVPSEPAQAGPPVPAPHPVPGHPSDPDNK